MKKLLVCLLALCVLTGSASADVLVELDDSFWRAHRDECDYLYRAYTVNSPEGYAAIWESPKSSRQKETLPNGTKVSGIWHYTDGGGEVWCAVYGEGWSDRGENVRGWIRTSECTPVPDYISCKETHGEEFVGYDRAYDHAFDALETFVLWTYPCSGVVSDEDMDAEWYQRNETPANAFSTCWRDGEGRLWAFVAYCYGHRNAWVCLDDPANTELAADETLLPEVTLYPPAEQVPAPNSSGVTALTIGAVAAVVVVTGGLLFVFFRKRKTK